MKNNKVLSDEFTIQKLDETGGLFLSIAFCDSNSGSEYVWNAQ